MIKEYMAPEMEVLSILTESSVLAGSVGSSMLEDFIVTEGEW